jgi:hypothetical protein
MKNKPSSGFVYIWFDFKCKRYYIGSHWGHSDDGYICSSKWMKSAYRKRPYDFKRRILAIKFDETSLLQEEGKWLSLIKDNELGTRYYNLSNHQPNHWCTVPKSRLTIQEKLSKSQIGKKLTEEHKENIRIALRKSYQNNPEPWKGRMPTKSARENYSKATKKKHEEGKFGIKGRVWYYNPILQKRIVIQKSDTPPEGFIKGRGKLGSYFYNPQTGEEVIKDKCPDGFISGRNPEYIRKMQDNRWKFT